MSDFTNHRNQLKRYESQAQKIINIFSAVGAFEDYEPKRSFYLNGFDEKCPKEPWEPKEGFIYIGCYTHVADYSESAFIEAPLEFFDNFDEVKIREFAQQIVDNRARAKETAKAKAQREQKERQEKADLEKLRELVARHPSVAKQILDSN